MPDDWVAGRRNVTSHQAGVAPNQSVNAHPKGSTMHNPETFRLLIRDTVGPPPRCRGWRHRRITNTARRPYIWLAWNPRLITIAVVAGRTDLPTRRHLHASGYRNIATVPTADIWVRTRNIAGRTS